MENNIKLNLRELGNRRVKIEVDQFSKLPSIEDYKRYIANLLGIYNTDNEKLKDEFNNADLGDGFLLYNELKKMDSSKYREVVFSGVNGDVIVNAENFEEVFNSLKNDKKVKAENELNKNAESIQHAIQEMFERG